MIRKQSIIILNKSVQCLIGPKINTIIDFWRMVWQENVHQIIMLTNIIEDGKVSQGCLYDNSSELTYKYNHSRYAYYL